MCVYCVCLMKIGVGCICVCSMMLRRSFVNYFYFNDLGITFVVTADPSLPGMEVLLKKIYETYSNYALKNPFYVTDMPIRYIIIIIHVYIYICIYMYICICMYMYNYYFAYDICYRSELFDQYVQQLVDSTERSSAAWRSADAISRKSVDSSGTRTI